MIKIAFATSMVLIGIPLTISPIPFGVFVIVIGLSILWKDDLSRNVLIHVSKNISPVINQFVKMGERFFPKTTKKIIAFFSSIGEKVF